MRPHDLPNHKLEFGKSPLYPRGPRRVKRTHIANQMKRVQRANGSLAQVWGRAAPNGLPAESMARLRGLRKSALTPRRRLRFPVPSFSVGIAIKKRSSPK